MSILLGFAPFIAFFVLLRLGSAVAGLGAAAAISLWLCLRTWRRKEAIKILESGSFVLFAALFLYSLAAAPTWTVATVRLLVDGGLLIIVLLSLAIGRPFTMQYAREQVAQKYWTSPLFIRSNRLITAVWAAAFAVLTAADAAADYVPALPLGLDIAAAAAALLAALGFTAWYPAQLRRRMGAAERPAA
jgi:hypothetical protein